MILSIKHGNFDDDMPNAKAKNSQSVPFNVYSVDFPLSAIKSKHLLIIIIDVTVLVRWFSLLFVRNNFRNLKFESLETTAYNWMKKVAIVWNIFSRASTGLSFRFRFCFLFSIRAYMHTTYNINSSYSFHWIQHNGFCGFCPMMIHYKTIDHFFAYCLAVYEMCDWLVFIMIDLLVM